MALTIRTNHQWRPISYGFEVPEEVLQSEFDWADNPDELMFVKYKGIWHCISEFIRVPEGAFEGDWDGYQNDTFFSGVLVKFSDDQDHVKMGRYCS